MEKLSQRDVQSSQSKAVALGFWLATAPPPNPTTNWALLWVSTVEKTNVKKEPWALNLNMWNSLPFPVCRDPVPFPPWMKTSSQGSYGWVIRETQDGRILVPRPHRPGWLLPSILYKGTGMWCSPSRPWGWGPGPVQVPLHRWQMPAVCCNKNITCRGPVQRALLVKVHKQQETAENGVHAFAGGWNSGCFHPTYKTRAWAAREDKQVFQDGWREVKCEEL